MAAINLISSRLILAEEVFKHSEEWYTGYSSLSALLISAAVARPIPKHHEILSMLIPTPQMIPIGIENDHSDGVKRRFVGT